MTIRSRIYGLIVDYLVLASCQSKMIPIHNLYNQPVNSGLSPVEIGAEITQGVKSEVWQTELTSTDSIFATCNIRAHTVMVNIGNSDPGYSIVFSGVLGFVLNPP